MTKITLTAAALTLAASSAFAGGLDQPVVEMTPVEIIEDTTTGSSSGAGLIVPLILVALIAAAVSSGD